MSQALMEQSHLPTAPETTPQSIDPKDIPYADRATIENALQNPFISEEIQSLCNARIRFIDYYEQELYNIQGQWEILWIWNRLVEEQHSHQSMDEEHLHPNLEHLLSNVTDYLVLKTIVDRILEHHHDAFCDSIFDHLLIKARELADIMGVTEYADNEELIITAGYHP